MKFVSVRKCWIVLSVDIGGVGWCMWVCLCTLWCWILREVFSLSIIKGSDAKCKWEAKENLVVPNYKRWGNQITVKWKCSQPFFQSVLVVLKWTNTVIFLIFFFYAKATAEVTESCVQYSRWFLFLFWDNTYKERMKRIMKLVWSENYIGKSHS